MPAGEGVRGLLEEDDGAGILVAGDPCGGPEDLLRIRREGRAVPGALPGGEITGDDEDEREEHLPFHTTRRNKSRKAGKQENNLHLRGEPTPSFLFIPRSHWNHEDSKTTARRHEGPGFDPRSLRIPGRWDGMMESS